MFADETRVERFGRMHILYGGNKSKVPTVRQGGGGHRGVWELGFFLPPGLDSSQSLREQFIPNCTKNFYRSTSGFWRSLRSEQPLHSHRSPSSVTEGK